MEPQLAVTPEPPREEPGRAQFLSLISRYRLDRGDVAGAQGAAEEALRLLSTGDPLELKAQCYVTMGEALLQGRKPRQAARLMLKYLRTRSAAPTGVLDGRVLLIAGESLLELGHHALAERLLGRADPWLKQGALTEHLDRCYRARLQVRYAQGALTEAHRLLQSWEQEMPGRPKKDPGRIRLCYDKAYLQARLGNYTKVIRQALMVLELADEHDVIHFDTYLLLSSTAANVGEPREALGFALTARTWALDHGQWDLETTATQAMVQLIQAHGEPLISGVQDLYRVHGIDITQFIPNNSQRSDEPWV